MTQDAQKDDMLQHALKLSEKNNAELKANVLKMEGQVALYSANLVALQAQRDSLMKTDLEVRVALEQEKANHSTNVYDAKELISQHTADLESVRDKFGQVQHKCKVAEQQNTKMSEDYSTLEGAIGNYLSLPAEERPKDLDVPSLLNKFNSSVFDLYKEEHKPKEEPKPEGHCYTSGPSGLPGDNVKSDSLITQARKETVLDVNSEKEHPTMPSDEDETSNPTVIVESEDRKLSKKNKRASLRNQVERKRFIQEERREEPKEEREDKDY